MKKKALLSILLITMFSISLIAGCGKKEDVSTPLDGSTPTESADPGDDAAVPGDTTYRIGALKGPTAMGMAQLLDASNYEFTLAASPDEIVPLVVQGKLDIASVPANLAAVLYAKTNKQIEVLDINTLGVLYLVEKGENVTSAGDLKGKTIYASGKGATPEYALDYVLKANGIDPEKDVTIEWKSEHAEVVAALTADTAAVGLLPQPFVTVAQIQNDTGTPLRIALDMNQLWENSQKDGSKLVMGVTVVRKEFLDKNPEAVKAFLADYKASVDFVNADPASAAEMIGAHDIIAAPVAKQAIPKCNIVFIDGQEMKTSLSAYLNTLLDQNPETVGGALPQDDFYYVP